MTCKNVIGSTQLPKINKEHAKWRKNVKIITTNVSFFFIKRFNKMQILKHGCQNSVAMGTLSPASLLTPKSGHAGGSILILTLTNVQCT